MTVLNKDDGDWYWIVRSDGHEGFVPASFLCSTEAAYGKATATMNGTAGPLLSVIGAANGMTINNNNNSSQQNQNGINLKPNPINPNVIITDGHQQRPDLESSSNSNMESGSMSMTGVSGGGPVLGMTTVATELNTGLCSEADSLSQGQPSTLQPRNNNGTELVMLYDYKAQAPDDLSVRRGDWVYADLTNQTIEGWLWVFAPKLRKYGFIPKAYARPPAMTSL